MAMRVCLWRVGALDFKGNKITTLEALEEMAEQLKKSDKYADVNLHNGQLWVTVKDNAIMQKMRKSVDEDPSLQNI